MIKIRLGGWPFILPQRWEEVGSAKAKKLAQTKPEDIRERLYILGGIPTRDKIELSPDVVLAAYEVISFIEELPELVPNKHDIADLKHWIENEWTFAEFETARKVILKHQKELSTGLIELAEIKGMEADYLEIGSKALDGINQFTMQYEQFGLYEDQEPSAEEELAGIDRLQAFGVYPILEQLGQKYGKYPKEIEKEPVGWVMLEYAHNFVKDSFIDKMRKLHNKT